MRRDTDGHTGSCRASGKCQWPRKQNVSGTSCGRRPRTVTPTLRPTALDVRADQRPASRRFGELMVRHELQVGTAWPPAATRRRNLGVRPAPPSVRWVAGRPRLGPVAQAWFRVERLPAGCARAEPTEGLRPTSRPWSGRPPRPDPGRGGRAGPRIWLARYHQRRFCRPAELQRSHRRRHCSVCRSDVIDERRVRVFAARVPSRPRRRQRDRFPPIS